MGLKVTLRHRAPGKFGRPLCLFIPGFSSVSFSSLNCLNLHHYPYLLNMMLSNLYYGTGSSPQASHACTAHLHPHSSLLAPVSPLPQSLHPSFPLQPLHSNLLSLYSHTCILCVCVCMHVCSLHHAHTCFIMVPGTWICKIGNVELDNWAADIVLFH